MRKHADDFDPQVLSLFDKYVHGLITRRDFLEGASKVTVGITGLAALEALSPNFAEAQQIKPDDARLKADFIEIPSPGYGKVRAYRVAPANPKGKLPVILVVHENRGLNPHIEDIARRIALDNFIAVAPDALFPVGGYPGDEDKARELFQTLDQEKTRQDFVATAHYLKKLPEGNGKLGAVGFCYGGGVVNYLATQVPELNDAVAFYGSAPKLEDVPHIKAPLLLHFAGNDERVNASWPPYESALKQAHAKYEAFVYPNTQHGFNNDTTPRYDEKAAKLAWDRTMKFFDAELK
ncbi:MAG TPA: dienelactone hydrolase family protein [Steroidobacteraceae bacterium]|nr:dienelactone hydrolase family protein [Steroidobacteraceae bacterium]